jgi:hypothetical protein
MLQDHLIAALAAFGILVASTGLLHERALGAAQQTRLFGARAALTAFTEVLEQDIRSIGSGVPTGAPMLEAPEPDRFAFFGTADSTATPRAIAYEWEALAPGPGGEPRYVVTRYVAGDPAGRSPLLSAFEVALRDAAGDSIAAGALDEARRVRVRLELVPPFEDLPARGRAVGRVAWEAEFAPSNLARREEEHTEHPLLQLHVALTRYGD